MSHGIRTLLLCNSRMAVPALQHLHLQGALAAVAVPDLYDFVQQPFRELAGGLGLPFISLNRETFQAQLEEAMTTFAPDAVLVISFPWKIRLRELPAPSYGFLNFHGGLLPLMRGSDPMFHCIRNGIYHTGLTVHQMSGDMDSGDVILEEPIVIDAETTHGMLSSRIAYACEKACGSLLKDMQAGRQLPATPQNESEAEYLPRPSMADTYINWNTMDAADIRALVNACNPQLKGATAIFANWKFNIGHVTEINLTGDDGRFSPGTILYADPQQGLIIYCRDGKALRVDVSYAEEGFFPGYKLAMFGLAPGLKLLSPAGVPEATDKS